jgi:hypothetical protein
MDVESASMAGELAVGHARPHEAGGEHRPPLEQLDGQRLEPASEGGLLARLPHRRDGQLDEVGSLFEVVARHRVANRLRPLPVLLKPLGSPPMEDPDVDGPFLRQARSQDVGEQVVVAVPVPAVVQRNEEQVRPLQRLQHGLPVFVAGQGVAQGAVHPAQDRCLQQEAPDVVRLSLEHLTDEVVDDVAVVTGEAGDELGRVLPTLHRQRRQLQSGDPAFGPPVERRNVLLRQIEAHHAVEVRGGLLRCEPKIGGTDLEELTPGPQPRQREGRVGPAGDHEVHLGWQVVDQERHPLVHLVHLDHVVVVEHQDDVARDRIQIVEKRGQNGLQRRLRRLEERERSGTHVGYGVLQRSDQVSPEQAGVVVALVERQPRRRAPVVRSGRHPLRDERRLAEPGRRRHERQRRLRDEVQSLPEPRPLHNTAAPPGDVELGLEQRARDVWAWLVSRHHPMVPQEAPQLSGTPGPGRV